MSKFQLDDFLFRKLLFLIPSIVWKISLLLIMVSLSACREASVKKREERILLDKIVKKHSQIMFEMHGLNKWSYYTYNGDGGISAVSVGMEILGAKDMFYARKMILEASRDLLERLLEEPILKPLFVDKKIDYKNISYAIFFKNKKRDHWVCHDLRDWKNQLNMVRLRDGEILYMAKGIESDSRFSFSEKIETLDKLEE